VKTFLSGKDVTGIQSSTMVDISNLLLYMPFGRIMRVDHPRDHPIGFQVGNQLEISSYRFKGLCKFRQNWENFWCDFFTKPIPRPFFSKKKSKQLPES
jgi:hypothetical protein